MLNYCRWSDDSDVYVYADVSGGFTCCGCTSNIPTRSGLIAHLHQHRDRGNRVPDKVFRRLHRELKTFGEATFEGDG